MSRRFMPRGTATLCTLVGVAALSIRRDAAVDSGPGHSAPSHLSQRESVAASVPNEAKASGAAAAPHHFSMQYDYCYVDTEGRPMIFHRRRLVFYLPESPPKVNDRTFIETDLCQ